MTRRRSRIAPHSSSPAPSAPAPALKPSAAKRWPFATASCIVVNATNLVFAFAVLVPLLWMLRASFAPRGASMDGSGILFVPWTLEQYHELITRLDVLRYFGNSVFLAATVTAVSLLFNALAGYAFAKLDFPGRDRIFQAILLTLLIPTQVAVLPLFLLLRQCGLVNSYLAVVFPAAASAYGIFLIRQYARSIPDGLLDAARMDGASEGRIFFQLVLPWIRPILVALGVFTFLTAWNDFMWPLIVLTDDQKYTLPVALSILSGEHVQDVELMMAGAVVTVAPVLVLFLFLQKHLMGGIVQGGMHG